MQGWKGLEISNRYVPHVLGGITHLCLRLPPPSWNSM